MKHVFLLLILAQLGSAVWAQPPGEGFYVSATASQQVVGAEIGYWAPSFGEMTGASGYGDDSVGILAVRAGVEGGEVAEGDDFEVRLHLEAGVGGERIFLMLGPSYAFGTSDLSGAWGLRVSSGYHINDFLTLGCHWEVADGRRPNIGGQVIVTF